MPLDLSVPLTFRAIVDWSAERLAEAASAIEAAGAPAPHLYRWWEPGMSDPAAYLWMEPAPQTTPVDTCTVRDDVRMVLAFTVLPGAHEGEDMATVELVLDAALPVIDRAIPELSRAARKRAQRGGFRVVRDDTSGDGAPKALIVEIPVTVPWHQDVNP